ncbi:MAG: hypothetical protein CFE26_06025 [Verrucomicrobiales bacterium VVV1]|nr:MAG: hypothetical protein CFE26_06025 [Verrucomicrobiales bacterium VVV1]
MDAWKQVFRREDEVRGRKSGHRSRDEEEVMEGMNRDSQRQMAGRNTKRWVPWGSAGHFADGVPVRWRGLGDRF